MDEIRRARAQLIVLNAKKKEREKKNILRKSNHDTIDNSILFYKL